MASKNAKALSREGERLLRQIVADCLNARGLPSDAAAVAGAIELIEAGFAVIKSDGVHHWLEAVDG